MASMQNGLAHGEVTEAIIGAAFEVHSALGYGFLEAVYRNAMAVELRKRGLDAVTESRMEVRYKGEVVGTYSADMVVNDTVIVEFKVAEEYRKADEAQLLNELAATGKPVGLLINFGRRKVEFKRLVWSLGAEAKGRPRIDAD
jgi:GxxExxY protein